MFLVRRVVGDSMSPTLREGQIVVAIKKKKVDTGAIVIASIDGREVIKRVGSINSHGFELVGDNPEKSTDSRDYGLINHDQIIGKVIYPKAL